MGKASITIAIGALWNGSSTISKVSSELSSMAARISASDRSLSQAVALQSRKFQDLGTSVHDAGVKIQNVGRVLTDSITKPMAVVGGYSVVQAKKFDTAMFNLNKTANVTAEQLKSLADEALASSRVQPITAAQIMDAEALGAQLGITTDNLKSFADTANGLNIATNMDVETASKNMARFANITRMSQSQLSNYGSTIVDLGNNFATTESEISDMSLRLAGISTIAGFTEADIMGIAAAMSSMGIKAEAGGSAMTRIVSDIAKAVTDGGSALEAYASAAGMSADAFATSWRSKPVEALQALIAGIQHTVEAGGDMEATLESIGIKNIRTADAMRRLAGNSDLLKDAVGRANTAWEQNTALTTEVDKRNQSLEARMQTLKNKADAVAIQIGSPLADALLDAADAAQPLIDSIASAVQAFADMDEGSQKTVLALAGVAFAAGPVLSITGKLVQGIGNVTTAFGNFQSAAAIYSDALATTDGRQMRVYSSSKEMSAQLGTAKNAAAQAAGGVKNYVAAFEKMEDSAKIVNKTTHMLKDNDDALNALARTHGTSSKAYQKAADKLADINVRLEQQRDAAKKAYTENATLVSKWSGSTAQAEKFAAGIDELDGSLKQVKAGFAAASTGAQEMTRKAKTSESALKRIKDAASNMGSGIANGFKLAGASAAAYAKNIALAAATTAGIGLAIAGVTAAVGAVASKIGEAKQRTENLTAATQGLIDASTGTAHALDEAGNSAESYSVSVKDARAKVDAAISSQAQLAKGMNSTTNEASAQITQLTNAYDTIRAYANQSQLTSEQQAKLKAAVQTVNEQTGAQIQLTDASNGKLADQNGAITDVTAALSGYIDKKIEQIRLEAQQQNLKDLYAQRAKDIEAMATAQAAYNEQLKGHDNFITSFRARTSASYEEAEAAWNKYMDSVADSTGLKDAAANLNATDVAIGNLESSMTSAASVADGTAASVAAFVKASGDVEAALASSGKSVDDFANDLAACGLSVQQFKELNAQQIVELTSLWDGSQQSLAAALDGMGITFSDKGAAAVSALVAAMQAGQIDVETASKALQAASAGDWGPAMQAFQAAGIALPQSLADGLNSGSYQATEATSYLMSLVALKLSGGDLEQAAQMVGGNIDQGLADGIRNGTLAQDEAAYLGQSVIEKAKESLGVHSPSTVFAEIGTNVDEGLAQGITDGQDTVTSAVEGLGNILKTGMDGIVDFFTGKGGEASGGLASGIMGGSGNVSAASGILETSARNPLSGIGSTLGGFGSGAGSAFGTNLGSYAQAVLAASSRLDANAKTPLSGTPNAAGGYGRNAGTSFAGGINAASGTTRSAALANAREVGNMKVSGTWEWGSHLASNFAAGIRAGIGWVSSAASAIADAAKSILKFSVPKAGPWSGAERGGMTSGLHLAQNFAAGMRSGIPEIAGAATSIAKAAAVPYAAATAAPLHGSAYGVQAGQQQNIYNIGTVTLDASRFRSGAELEDFVSAFETAIRRA